MLQLLERGVQMMMHTMLEALQLPAASAEQSELKSSKQYYYFLNMQTRSLAFIMHVNKFENVRNQLQYSMPRVINGFFVLARKRRSGFQLVIGFSCCNEIVLCEY
eukprot:TRINITY_DN67076_c0_g1_i1.p2 TRINITY_DN67076_c0_g1~~TRINITY_DN67076_c0_g1_i1.p2  ORF type:complete len:113 (-),score=8.16 TRINITY_DN67076_c0_g1_i1:52-366(-)